MKFLFLLILFLNPTYSDYIVKSEIISNFDDDKTIDTIQLCQNVLSEDRFLNITISNFDNLNNYKNYTAIPNYKETTLSCSNLYKDSLGFSFTIENGNGNVHKSKKFSFRRFGIDIVLYRINELYFSSDKFIQDHNIRNFVFENASSYDSIYSIKYFDYNLFW
ncbi:MAG: hypothetical protein ACE364_07940 [Chlorobiota bacterium]